MESRARLAHLAGRRYSTGELTSASLFDLALLAYRLDYDRGSSIRSASTFRSPESAEEALGGATSSTRSSRPRAGSRARSKRWRWSNRIRSRTRWKSFSTICAITSSGLISGAGITWRASIHFNLNDPNWVLARSQYDPVRRAVFSEPAHADAGDLAQARRARDRRHDRALSRPRGIPSSTRARSKCSSATRRTKRVSDGRRVDRASRPERDRRRAVPDPESTRSTARRSRRTIPICAPRPVGVGTTHARRHARRGAHRHSLSQRRARRAAARVCSTATWKISRPTASTA